MVHEILPSDEELARGMLHSGDPEDQVIACLSTRGVKADEARQLVHDLRLGCPPHTGTTDRKAHDLPSTSGRRHHRHKHQHDGIPWWFVLLLLLFVLALGYAFLEAGSDAALEKLNERKHDIPAPPTRGPER